MKRRAATFYSPRLRRLGLQQRQPLACCIEPAHGSSPLAGSGPVGRSALRPAQAGRGGP
jgi:hypothetical protein